MNKPSRSMWPLILIKTPAERTGMKGHQRGVRGRGEPSLWPQALVDEWHWLTDEQILLAGLGFREDHLDVIFTFVYLFTWLQHTTLSQSSPERPRLQVHRYTSYPEAADMRLKYFNTRTQMQSNLKIVTLYYPNLKINCNACVVTREVLVK